MNNRTLSCGHCKAEFQLAEAMLNHMTESGHGISPQVQKLIKEDKVFKNQLIANLIAVQTCNDPSEIGAEPVVEKIEKEDG